MTASAHQFNHHSKGFTLIEIMVALAIFAVASAALVRNATISVHQTGLLRDRTIAIWVADNKLNELRSHPRIDENYPALGRNRAEVKMAGIQWEVVTEIVSTENASMRRIIVSVFKDSDPDVEIASLTGFIGRH